jgi:anti-sigma factor RsiW
MTSHDCRWVEERLHAWMDGELDTEESEQVESEVAACDACANELATVRKLRATVALLPREIQPPRDLWPAIVRSRSRPWIPLLAAAGVALSLVGARLLAAGAPPAPRAAEEAWRVELETANAAFREALAASADLDPEVHALVERNLADIDRAIAEIESALAKNPSSPMLRRALVAMEHQRLDVLRQLTLTTKAG